MSQRQRVQVRPVVDVEVEVSSAEEPPRPPRYPYLTCGYEAEREEAYLEWLESAREGFDTATPEDCWDRFVVLLGVFAGYRPDNPIDWWPVYEDLKAGDIAVIRLSGIHVPDELRNGRTVDISESPMAEGREGTPTPTLPRAGWLGELLEGAGSILIPPEALPAGDGPRYQLPPHEVFAEHSFVTGLGPIGLGLVMEDASGPNSFGYHKAPIGMFLPFPVELMDYALDPSRHEGEWFAGFGSEEAEGCPVPTRASMPDREGSEALSYLSPEEFRNFVTWIGEEYDPDGWFGEELVKLEAASEKIRSGGDLEESADDEGDDGESGETGWDTWDLASPSTTHRLESPWGIQMMTLEQRERRIHATAVLASGLDGAEVDAEVLERLRYAQRRFEEATADDALQVARNLLSLSELIDAAPEEAPEDWAASIEESVTGGERALPFPVRRLLVPVAPHQLDSLERVCEAADVVGGSLVKRRPVPDMSKPELDPGEDQSWSEVADDLAQIYLGWVRACLADDARTDPAVFAVPVHGEVWDEWSEALAEFWKSEAGNGGEIVDTVIDQLQGYSDSRGRWGSAGTIINSQFWTNPEHESAESVLVPVDAVEAASCWQLAHQYRAENGEIVLQERLDNLADGRKPDWADDLVGDFGERVLSPHLEFEDTGLWPVMLAARCRAVLG